MSFPPALSWLQAALASAASESFTSVSAPIQHAAIVAFEYGDAIQSYLAHSQRVLRVLAEEITRRLRRAGLRLETPQGAFYLWLDFSEHADKLRARGITESPLLCERLLSETGVAILPGSAFERSASELSARLAYVDFDGALALKHSRESALDAAPVESLLGVSCARVIRGIDALCAWVEAL